MPDIWGRFSAPAANEPDSLVEAQIFHVRMADAPVIGAEIAEAIWVEYEAAKAMPLAPLTRHHVLRLSLAL